MIVVVFFYCEEWIDWELEVCFLFILDLFSFLNNDKVFNNKVYWMLECRVEKIIVVVSGYIV